MQVDANVQDVVFVMHGIRDDGYWTYRIAKAIKEAAHRKENQQKAIMLLKSVRRNPNSAFPRWS